MPDAPATGGRGAFQFGRDAKREGELEPEFFASDNGARVPQTTQTITLLGLVARIQSLEGLLSGQAAEGATVGVEVDIARDRMAEASVQVHIALDLIPSADFGSVRHSALVQAAALLDQPF